MNIIYASSSVIPSQSANSVHVMNMCQAFARFGHQVTLIGRKSKQHTQDDYAYYGVEKIFSIKKVWWPAVPGGGLLYGLLSKAIFSNTDASTLVYGRSVYGIRRATKQGLRCIFEAHTPPRNKLHAIFQKNIFQSPQFLFLVVISHALKKEYQKQFPFLPEEKIVVAPDGANDPGNLIDAIKPQGPKKALHVGYIGSLYPGKGMELIIRLALLCSDVTFHIVGGGRKDILYWRKKAAETHNIYFYGHVSHGHVYHYLNAFDIVLAPYQNEVYTSFGRKHNIAEWMSPLKLFEYMAAGKAIICSDIPVCREVIVHEKNGILCSPTDAEAWCAAVRVLGDKKKRDVLSDHARESFEQRYSWKTRAEDILHHISRL
jgi:glycosyltransferase involved in cell wall biosynthesis